MHLRFRRDPALFTETKKIFEKVYPKLDELKAITRLDVNLKQIDGQAEISGISCIHRDGDINFDSVGKPIPEVEVRIAELVCGFGAPRVPDADLPERLDAVLCRLGLQFIGSSKMW